MLKSLFRNARGNEEQDVEMRMPAIRVAMRHLAGTYHSNQLRLGPGALPALPCLKLAKPIANQSPQLRGRLKARMRNSESGKIHSPALRQVTGDDVLDIAAPLLGDLGGTHGTGPYGAAGHQAAVAGPMLAIAHVNICQQRGATAACDTLSRKRAGGDVTERIAARPQITGGSAG